MLPRPPTPLQSQMMLLGCGSSGSGAAGYTPWLDAVAAKCIAAWGMQKLITGVTDAARVRESGGSTEADIGTLTTGAFDSSAFTTHVGGGSGFAAKLYDHMASNDLVQTTAAEQPQIVLSSIGGKPAAVFTGTESLETAGTVAGTNWGTGDFENWYVVMPTTLSGGDIALGARANYQPEFYTRASAANKPTVFDGAVRAFNTTLSINTTYLLRFYRHSGTLYCDVNNTQEANTFASSTDHNVLTSLALGFDGSSGDKAKSNIAFNAWFNQALTAGEANTLALLLGYYYSMTWVP